MTGSELRAWRMRHNMTEAQAAERVGVSQEMWSQMEGGEKRVPSRITDKIKSSPAPKLTEIMGRGPYRKG